MTCLNRLTGPGNKGIKRSGYLSRALEKKILAVVVCIHSIFKNLGGGGRLGSFDSEMRLSLFVCVFLDDDHSFG